MRDHARMLLRRRDRSFTDVVGVLGEYRDNIGDQVSGVGGMGASPSKVSEEQDSPGQRQKEALGHLMAYLSAA